MNQLNMRYKMRKVKKNWVIITITTIMTLSVFVFGAASVKADSETVETTTQSEQLSGNIQTNYESTEALMNSEVTHTDTSVVEIESENIQNAIIDSSEIVASSQSTEMANIVSSEQYNETDKTSSEQYSSTIASNSEDSITFNAVTADEGITTKSVSEAVQINSVATSENQSSEVAVIKSKESEVSILTDVQNQAPITSATTRQIVSSGIATLDAAALSYEFEKARIKGATDNNILSRYQENGKVMPSSLEYIDDFYDDNTGTSGTAFKVVDTNNVIIAYTGTDSEENGLQDILGADIIGIGLARGQHYQPAYNFYDKIASEYESENIILTGHSLGGNIAQRVALKKNAPNTVVYNSAPLYIPIVASLGNKIYESLRSDFDLLPSNKEEAKRTISDIKNEQQSFTGNVIRITTQKDWLNNATRTLGAVNLGQEQIIDNSGNHDLQGIIADVNQIAIVKSLVTL